MGGGVDVGVGVSVSVSVCGYRGVNIDLEGPLIPSSS